MIHEYAVDPDSLASFNEIWQALEQFGVAHGRVVVQCPKRWWAIVKQNLENARETLPWVEYKSLEERCIRLRDDRKIICRKNLNYKGEETTFIDAIAGEHSQRPFRAVLQLDRVAGSPVPVLSRFDLHNGNALWKVRCSQSVRRTSDDLAAAVAPLLRICDDLLLVDPYFASKPQEYQSLIKMLRAAHASGNSFKRVEVHTNTRGEPEFIRDKAKMLLAPRLPKGIEIKVFRWTERNGGERLHDRFVLTDRGGIASSYGWDAGDSGQTTELSLMDDDSYRHRWNQYQRETAAFDLAGEPFVIKACP